MNDKKYIIEKSQLIDLLCAAFDAGWKGYFESKECETEAIADKFLQKAEEQESCWHQPIVADACTEVEMLDPLLPGSYSSSSDAGVTIYNHSCDGDLYGYSKA